MERRGFGPFVSEHFSRPRRSLIVDRGSAATDARRLVGLDVAAFEYLIVVRPVAALLPPRTIADALARARTRGLDLVTIDGVRPDICYIVSTRAMSAVAAAGGVPGCTTIPQMLDRLVAAGVSLEAGALTRAQVSLLSPEEIRDVAALSRDVRRMVDPEAFLDVPQEARLRAALDLQQETMVRGRARLDEVLQRLPDRRRTRSGRVLVMLPSPYQSGAHAAWIESLPYLSSARVSFLVTEGTNLADAATARGFTVVPVHEGLAPDSAADTATLLETLDAIRPAVVHADGADAQWCAPLIRTRGARFVQHVRLTDVDRFRPSMAYADALVGVSRHVCDAIAARAGDAVRIEHISDGVCLESRPARDVDVRARGDGAETMCLCVGRVEPAKGQLRVLDIFRELRAHLDCRLTIVGACGSDPAYCDEVRDRVAASADVSWQPFTRDIADLYRQAHVVLVGSRNESLGMVGLEAMATGALVVAHRSTGYESLIDPEQQEGLLFGASERAANVADRIVAALRERDRYIANARRRVERDFDARIAAERLNALWRDLS
ncbi:MAG: glycosyltransferase family 4 protein [Acidobacteria bacterium]|nr:glycosyltransferase family 4 protein [Acidobacteriota bacterium]